MVGLKWRSAFLAAVTLSGALLASAPVVAQTIVALGASNTYGKGVSREQAYPAQLQAMLRAKGLQVSVINAGINGDTTSGMLGRLDSAVPKGTQVVILQPGGNDARRGSGGNAAANVSQIRSRLTARGVRTILLPNSALQGKPKQPDGLHLTPEGYRMLAEGLVSEVSSAISR